MLAILSRNKRKPSDYPSLAFHLIRLGQLLSALIVSIVLIFFVHQLHLEHYYVPWTFLLVRVPYQPCRKPTNPPLAPHSLPPNPMLSFHHRYSPLLRQPQCSPKFPGEQRPHNSLDPRPVAPNLEPNRLRDARPPLRQSDLVQRRRHNGLPPLQSPHRIHSHRDLRHHTSTPPRRPR